MFVWGTSSSFSPLYLIPKGLWHYMVGNRNPYNCTTTTTLRKLSHSGIKNTVFANLTLGVKSSLVKLFIGIHCPTLLSFSRVEHMGHPHLGGKGHFPHSHQGHHGHHLLQVERVLCSSPGKKDSVEVYIFYLPHSYLNNQVYPLGANVEVANNFSHINMPPRVVKEHRLGEFLNPPRLIC